MIISSNEIPKPDIVLRIGVAGNRDLPNDCQLEYEKRLTQIFDLFERRLEKLRLGDSAVTGPKSSLVQFYSANTPILRLVSGLADGCDQLASDLLLKRSTNYIQYQLAAVLPFATPTFRDCSPITEKALFDELIEKCSYVIELDGHYLANPKPETPDDLENSFAQQCRKRAYRAQAAMLLRQSDLLMAGAVTGKQGKAGGTLETVRLALEMGIPVLFLSLGTHNVSFLRKPKDLENADSTLTPNWEQALEEWVDSLLGDTIEARPGHHTAARSPSEKGKFNFRPEEISFLEEFFSGSEPQMTIRRWVWERIEKVFKSQPRPKSDRALKPFEIFRKRATTLNYHYSGLYRGTFFLSYSLAVVAVILAVLSLIIMLEASSEPRVNEHSWGWILLGLGLSKLIVLILIYKASHEANDERWSDKAVDYRYLAERLRSMYYLPLVRSFHPPNPGSAQYASRILRQSVVDWLFQAIVRHSPPVQTLQDYAVNGRTIRPDIAAAVAALRDGWMANQIIYHDGNAKSMGRMYQWLVKFGQALNLAVIGIVIADLAIVASLLGNCLSEERANLLHAASPWLIFFAAVLPAVVASLNGIRFQSECSSLADRSCHVARILAEFEGQAGALHALISTANNKPLTSLGAWTLEALDLAETCARITLDETAEWSVLYGKQLAEP